MLNCSLHSPLHLKCIGKDTAEILRFKAKEKPSESLLERSNGIGMFCRKKMLISTLFWASESV